jgi:hypothetical protein
MKDNRFLLPGIGLILILLAALLVTPGSTLEALGVHLPVIFKGYPPYPLVVSQAWTTDEAGTLDSEFAAGEVIQYHASGSNSGLRPIETVFTWRLSSYCGETQIHTETVTLGPGEWTAMYSQVAPVCSGITNFAFQADFNERQMAAENLFTVTNPVAPAVWALPAFDKCDNASLAEMNTWWYESPYWISNIYIGGIHRACPSADLTPEWVRTALDQGWALIPTWVGPQAPCTDYKYRFSYDLTEAYQQGRAEADAAALAAASLGLTSSGSGSTIIYYDLEGYSSPDYLPECREASKAFINGWVERMHELGSPAGVYGAACASYVRDWATIPNVPDDVWIAYWTYDEYDPGATVLDLLCVSNSLWDGSQRLRQYAGGHNEEWGNLTLNIDSNITDGQVLALLPDSPEETQTRQEIQSFVDGPAVEGLGTRSAEQAWILLDGRVYWTGDGGMSWADLSPGQAPILAATFLDEQHAWLVSGAGGAGFSVWRTADGGVSWQEALFTPANITPLDARPVALDFTTTQEGWMVLKLAGSANFNLGMLFHTTDGGITWEERSLPGGGTIDFVNATHGWTLAGPEGDALYETQDGGLSWQPALSSAEATLRMRDPLRHSLAGTGEISYVSQTTAWAYTRSGTCDELNCTSSSALWRTLDGGVSWVEVALPEHP